MTTKFLRTDNTTKRVISIKFVTGIDDDPDLSHLGEYSNRPTDTSIDRQARGDCGRGSCRYFTPTMTGEETGNPESPEQDYQRMEAYNRGDWWMMFCQAVATISINGVIQRVTSGGLGGVESDSGEEYISEVKAEEFHELRGILDSLGFTAEQINEAFAAAD